MKRIYFTKGAGIIFMLLAMVFGCTQVSENLNENNSGAENKPSNDTTPITVTLIGADGTELKVINATAGERVLLSSVSVENLSHWNTKSDGSGLSYKGAAVFSESVTLYAIYLQKYKIIYYLNGGKNHPQNIDSFTESDYDVKVNSPTRDGYIFAGWYYNKDFSGERITWITEYEHKRNHAQADITLYAKWEKVKEPGIYLSVGYSEFYWATGTNGNAYFMTKGNGEVYTYTFRAEKIRPFPDGFKFTTENGWMEQYQAYNKEKPTTDFTMLNPDEEVEVYYATKAEIKAIDTDGNLDATKFKVKETLLFKIGNEYTVTFDKTNMKVKITGDFGEVGSIITIPDGVTYISDSAFSNCDGLTNIIIPDSVTSIGNSAFSDCSNLTNVTIGKSVTSIGDFFDYCEELTSLTVADGNTAYKSYENCIYTINGKNLVAAAKKIINVTIPDGVTSIGSHVFCNSKSLTTITIPDSVIEIDYMAFDGCSRLTTVNYKGTRKQWNAINIVNCNYYLINADINYNYTGE